MSETTLAPWAAAARERIGQSPRFHVSGRVTKVVGQVIQATSLPVAVGEVCRVHPEGRDPLPAQVVGFHDKGILLMPLGELEGIHPRAAVVPLGREFHARVGPGLVGRVLDGLGRPIDGKGPLHALDRRPLSGRRPAPLDRARIDTPLGTGVRAIDGLLTLGRGQRIGIMAGSGVGKSVLLGMMARNSSADINVIALLGERGREVREFIERDLGPEGLARSVVIVATSDEPALVRASGALVATAIAEYFRDAGRDVLMMVDSVTRVAMAWREVGLAAGEPPATRGYPPSVFAQLPRLLERAGTARSGSITGLYTVLVEGDDFSEPVADAVRSILDGHIVLSRTLAQARHFPAIDVLHSVSRVRDAVIDPAHRVASERLLRLLAAWRAHEDLIAVGAYKPGADPEVDMALRHRDAIRDFLCQPGDDDCRYEDGLSRLLELGARLTARASGGIA